MERGPGFSPAPGWSATLVGVTALVLGTTGPDFGPGRLKLVLDGLVVLTGLPHDLRDTEAVLVHGSELGRGTLERVRHGGLLSVGGCSLLTPWNHGLAMVSREQPPYR